jgi:rubrerythrin
MEPGDVATEERIGDVKLYEIPCTSCDVKLAVPFDVAMRIALDETFVMCDACAHKWEGENDGCPICKAFGIDLDHIDQVG